MPFLKLLLISIGCLLIGSAATCGVLSGLASIPLSPLFACFGWFYICPIYGLVAAMWWIQEKQLPLLRQPVWYVVCAILLGGGFMAIFGFHNQGDELFYGLILGGSLAGGFAAWMITVLRRSAASLK